MNVEYMTHQLHVFLEDAGRLAASKNRDYHPEGVAYLEILRNCFEVKLTVEKDLWLRMKKQLSALHRFVIDGHVESEPPRSRMIDVANYMAILSVWTHFKLNILEGAIEHVRGRVACESDEQVKQDDQAFLDWLVQYRNETVSIPSV